MLPPQPRLGIQVRSKYATPLTPSQNTPLVPLPGNTSASDVGIVKTKPEVVEKVSDKPEGLGADAIHPQTNPHINSEAASVVEASTSAPPGAADEEFEGISNDELILSLEEELARDLEGVDLDDFDMDVSIVYPYAMALTSFYIPRITLPSLESKQTCHSLLLTLILGEF